MGGELDFYECQSLLLRELNYRKERNPNFSLRAFAKLLCISPAQLSQLISGKRRLTERQALKIAEKLSMSPNERIEILRNIRPDFIPKDDSPTEVFQILEDDQFKLISEWYHYAILSLGDLKNCKADTRWITKRLGISELQAIDAFSRLKRMGIIKIIGGKFKQVSKPLFTSSDRASIYIRRYHQKNLSLASEKLEIIPVEKRDFSSMTFAVNTKKLSIAKKLIQDFEKRLCKELEAGDKSEVYTLSVQLFPLTIDGESK